MTGETYWILNGLYLNKLKTLIKYLNNLYKYLYINQPALSVVSHMFIEICRISKLNHDRLTSPLPNWVALRRPEHVSIKSVSVKYINPEIYTHVALADIG